MNKKQTRKNQRKKKEEKPVVESSRDSKKNTSLRLDKQTLKALKIRAIEQDTSVQKLIETLVKDYLAKHS